MIWQQIHAFFLMGGYAGYVWTAFAVVMLVLALNIIYSWHKQRNTILMLAERLDE